MRDEKQNGFELKIICLQKGAEYRIVEKKWTAKPLGGRRSATEWKSQIPGRRSSRKGLILIGGNGRQPALVENLRDSDSPGSRRRLKSPEGHAVNLTR
jgi:hypothetical protein